MLSGGAVNIVAIIGLWLLRLMFAGAGLFILYSVIKTVVGFFRKPESKLESEVAELKKRLKELEDKL